MLAIVVQTTAAIRYGFCKSAKAAGDCHFWFIETRRYANELFKKRLNDAFEAHGLRGEEIFYDPSANEFQFVSRP